MGYNFFKDKNYVQDSIPNNLNDSWNFFLIKTSLKFLRCSMRLVWTWEKSWSVKLKYCRCPWLLYEQIRKFLGHESQKILANRLLRLYFYKNCNVYSLERHWSQDPWFFYLSNRTATWKNPAKMSFQKWCPFNNINKFFLTLCSFLILANIFNVIKCFLAANKRSWNVSQDLSEIKKIFKLIQSH